MKQHNTNDYRLQKAQACAIALTRPCYRSKNKFNAAKSSRH